MTHYEAVLWYPDFFVRCGYRSYLKYDTHPDDSNSVQYSMLTIVQSLINFTCYKLWHIPDSSIVRGVGNDYQFGFDAQHCASRHNPGFGSVSLLCHFHHLVNFIYILIRILYTVQYSVQYTLVSVEFSWRRNKTGTVFWGTGILELGS